jgi:hypothetical protein
MNIILLVSANAAASEVETSRLGERGVPLIEIVFVADQQDGEFFVGIVPGLFDPLREIVEGGAVGDVVPESGERYMRMAAMEPR